MSRIRPINSAKRRVRKEQLSRRHGQRCAYCRRPFSDLREATLDHIAPQSLWRSWSVTSLMLACVDCNRAKADRLPLSLALMLLRWAEPTRPVVRPVDWPLLARLVAVHESAPTSVTTRVTLPVTPDAADGRSTPDLHESSGHAPARSTVRPDCLRAPRPVRVCGGPTREAVYA
ncbi:HNH endonuclease [Streptomyces griseoluteus]